MLLRLCLLLLSLMFIAMRVEAVHPLSNQKTAITIEGNEIGLKLSFYPLYSYAPNSTSGLVMMELGEDNLAAYVYTAVEKQEGISDVYMLHAEDSGKCRIQFIVDIKSLEDKRVRVRLENMSTNINSSFTRYGLAKDVTDICKDAIGESWDTLQDMAKNIAIAYQDGGRRVVRERYGISRGEKIRKNNEEVQAATVAKEQQAKKKEPTLPKLDKHGCIAYVENPNLAKVISKKTTYKDGRIYWTCKVKNICQVPISCFVTIKCYTKDGIEIVDGIESVHNIAPGEERIISDNTVRVSETAAKKIKRKEFTVSPYTR